MLSFSAKQPLRTAVTRLRAIARPHSAEPDAVSAYRKDHPGATRLGHVLWHLEDRDGIRPADLVLDGDTLVLLDRSGTELMRIPRERMRAAGCAPATVDGCRDARLPQSEQHVFIGFVTEDGIDARLELSVGALDDIGPVEQMCESLRVRMGLEPAAE